METETAVNGIDGKALYLFCLARHDLLPDIEGVGVDGQGPLFVRTFGDIAAVLNVVSIEEFCGQSAEVSMQDLAWLGPRACRHEEVIEQVTRHSPVLPARFATLFSSLEQLEKLITTHRSAIVQFLDRVAGKEEWAVKGLLDRAKAKKELLTVALAAQEEYISASSPGSRYFQEQRIRAGVETKLNNWLKETCKSIGNDLNCHAEGSCERTVVLGSTARTDTEVILNWAFLVPRSAVVGFRARVAQANADHTVRGLIFEISGPWPPYSFSPSQVIESGL